MEAARIGLRINHWFGSNIAAFGAPHYDEPMSFSETIFLFFLALIIFGPKKLPEIARQAGRLLAELRRASNEFRSQIETEIAHLEVAKKAQEILPPSSAPPGAVASLSLNPAANEAVPPVSQATLAAPVDGSSAVSSSAHSNSSVPTSVAENPESSPIAPTASESEIVPTPQDSHV
jgi:sec-independent protein translocase protein TatB